MALLLILFALAVPGSHVSASATAPTVRKVTVPRIVGRLLPDAKARLQRAGLRVKVVRVRSLQPIATVVSSRPTAGKRVPRASLVKIAVSRGPGP